MYLIFMHLIFVNIDLTKCSGCRVYQNEQFINLYSIKYTSPSTYFTYQQRE